jgi:chromosome segregation ATPase
MTPRRRRIERILEHRRKELSATVLELSEANGRLARATAEAEARDEAVRAASDARRRLFEGPSDALTFLELEEWLHTTTLQAQQAWARVAVLRSEVAAVQARVMAVRMKVRQVEQVAARIDAAERQAESRKERRRDDEDAARIAQRRGAMAGSK